MPKEIRRRRGEANFLGAFLRLILSSQPQPILFGRNFPVSGCGVADLLLCQVPKGVVPDGQANQFCLMAFEMKLNDWRKALHQAYRYKYYADHSIVVLPEKTSIRAVQSRDIFEALGVELWTLDATKKKIIKHVAFPGQTGPLNTAKRSLALSQLSPRLTNLSLSHEET
ncbi:MAG: hypothetical protein GX594_11710 [Pirellulaceae bacterium]|nr:hypothetical protein [Pirellulaceae bacterium]